MSQPVKLSELGPKLISYDGVTDHGITFWCPKCRDHRVFVHFKNAPALTERKWERTGVGVRGMTLSPSVVAYRRDEKGALTECWHGHIRNGEVTGV